MLPHNRQHFSYLFSLRWSHIYPVWRSLVCADTHGRSSHHNEVSEIGFRVEVRAREMVPGKLRSLLPVNTQRYMFLRLGPEIPRLYTLWDVLPLSAFITPSTFDAWRRFSSNLHVLCSPTWRCDIFPTISRTSGIKFTVFNWSLEFEMSSRPIVTLVVGQGY